MESHGIQADTGYRHLTATFLLFRSNQAGAQIPRQIVRIGDIVGVAFSCAPVDNGDTAYDAAHDTDCSGGHAKIRGFLPSQSGEGGADRGRRTVPTVEAGSQHQTESRIQIKEVI